LSRKIAPCCACAAAKASRPRQAAAIVPPADHVESDRGSKHRGYHDGTCPRDASAARARVERDYNWDTISRAQSALYRELLG